VKRQRIDIKKTIKKRIEHRQGQYLFIEKRGVRNNNINSKLEEFKNKSMNERSLKRAYGDTVLMIPNKKINVIISAYDCAEFIEECLNSVNSQTYKAEKILLGIDGCTKTLLKVLEIYHKYSNLEVFYAEKNTGPYQVFNSLIELVPDDEYIQIFGADDVMHPDMLEIMSKYDTPVISRNDGVLFVKKETISKVGGFRDWKCAADSDMIFRLKWGINMNVKRESIHFFRREHDKQLTKMESTNRNSKLRKKYIKIFENNKHSPNPDIYIEPVCNPIIKINN
jgi:glycosyltransferase involved in cell wall biosynthesis